MGGTGNIVNPKTVLSAGEYKIIYVFSHIGVAGHEGKLKVGETSISLTPQQTAKFLKNQQDPELIAIMEKAAENRIRQINGTSDIETKLEHVELAVRESAGSTSNNETWEGFGDRQIHEVLRRSGYTQDFLRKDKKHGEWFQVDLESAKAAIKAYKDKRFYVDKEDYPPIVLRPEQKRAVDLTLKAFSRASSSVFVPFLWNAKMRFGKTLAAYSLVKTWDENEKISSPRRVLIITHRPLDTAAAWNEDFQKMRFSDQWGFGTDRGGIDVSWEELKGKEKFFYFASIQNLRDSFESDSFNKNSELFNTQWDLVISDEVHNGTLTKKAKRVYKELKTYRYLDLSGTPFNVIQAQDWEDIELAKRFAYNDNIFSWSYVDEQKAKREWEKDKPGEPNPYDGLPEIKFITYDIKDVISNLNNDEYPDMSLNELFRVENDSFIHEDQVLNLLKKLKDSNYSTEATNFPFNPQWNGNFNHTLWMLPSVDSCGALKALLGRSDSPFEGFEVVNATGKGRGTKNTPASQRWTEKTALDEVKSAIAKNKRTITLSWGMLTAGVTVPEWTAVFMLNNTTSPMAYMQTAFRATSPGSLSDGRIKNTAFVFDFNPDRCLQKVVELAEISSASITEKNKVTVGDDKSQTKAVEEILDYISILTLKDAKFVTPNSQEIMDHLNRVYIEEAINSGFTSPHLWDKNALKSFNVSKAAILERLRKITGEPGKRKAVIISDPGLTDEEKRKIREIQDKLRSRNNPPLTSEEKETLNKELGEIKKKDKKHRQNRRNAIEVLANVASRLPMLIFASEITDDITPENFIENIDHESWIEFMPKNLGQKIPEGLPSLTENSDEELLAARLGDENGQLYWDDIKGFFNQEMFTMASKRIWELTKDAWTYEPLERFVRLAHITHTWRKPGKETVLTPLRAVQLQLSETLGGLGIVDLVNSTADQPLILARNKETGEEESIPLKNIVRALDMGTYELAPTWSDPKDLWKQRNVKLYEINGKTALYPLNSAMNIYWANKEVYKTVRAEAQPGALLTETQLTKDHWSDLLRKCIFMNVRVPYSKKIAQRMLGGFDSELRETVDKNTTTIDIVRLRNSIKNWNNLKPEVRPAGWTKIKDEHIFIGKILRLSNRGFMELYSENGEEFEDQVIPRINAILEQINESKETPMEIKELEELVNGFNGSLPEFSAVVGNPPYTESIDTGDSKNSAIATSVYPDFFAISYFIARFSSIISPARWISSADGATKSARTFIKEHNLEKKFVKFFYEADSENVFPNVIFSGGVSWFLFDSKADGETEFTFNGKSFGKRPLFTKSGLVSIDLEHDILINKIWYRDEDTLDTMEKVNDGKFRKLEVLDWLNGVQGVFIGKYGKASTEIMVKHSSATKVNDSDIRLRIPKYGWRYVSRDIFNKDNAFVPAEKFSISFTHASHWKHVNPLNDRSFFLKEFESAKSSMAIILDSPEQALNFYKYARTKFFRILVEKRLSSHNTYPQAYQDIPAFTWTSKDPIDWSLSISEIDEQLEKFFDLEEIHDYLQEVKSPFAAPFEQEYLDKFESYGVSTKGINQWYPSN